MKIEKKLGMVAYLTIGQNTTFLNQIKLQYLTLLSLHWREIGLVNFAAIYNPP